MACRRDRPAGQGPTLARNLEHAASQFRGTAPQTWDRQGSLFVLPDSSASSPWGRHRLGPLGRDPERGRRDRAGEDRSGPCFSQGSLDRDANASGRSWVPISIARQAQAVRRRRPRSSSRSSSAPCLDLEARRLGPHDHRHGQWPRQHPEQSELQGTRAAISIRKPLSRSAISRGPGLFRGAPSSRRCAAISSAPSSCAPMTEGAEPPQGDGRGAAALSAASVASPRPSRVSHALGPGTIAPPDRRAARGASQGQRGRGLP